ncbi:LuxR C-terminal-related transcriptional regulator [Leifsonia sp. NPDC056665]|uniref:LuxR C-terminal-related transcriptional regulator n=1 Tax=Leifsonia sp. NPDC056665 TaxID=3345901 RepID=UPI0036A9A5B9
MSGPVAGWKPSPGALIEPPAPQPAIVERDRVTTALDDSFARSRVVAVVAPAGSGKTTACAEWARAQRAPVLWVSVSRLDTGAPDFVRGVGSAARVLEPALQLDVSDVAWSVRSIAEVLRAQAGPTTVVVDDLHRDPGGDVVAALAELIALTPATRFLLISRTPLDLDAGVESATLGRADLDFTEGEIVAAARASGSDAEAALVLTRSGGWAAAVRALLARPPATDTGNDEALGRLVGRILETLGPELAEFAEETAVLNVLDADLARAVTGRGDAAPLLQECARRGLLIDSFADAGRVVYRWHDLFTEECGRRMVRNRPERLRQLHLRAAEELAADRPAAAVEHALAAGEPERALRVLKDQWLVLVLESGAATVDRMCQRLPHDLASLSQVLAIRACCAGALGSRSAGEMLAERARHADADDPETGDTLALATLFTEHSPQQLQDACDHIASGLGREPWSPRTYAATLFILGWAELRLRRDPARAIDLLGMAYREAVGLGLDLIAHRAAANSAFALTFAGRFSAARDAIDALPAAGSSVEWVSYDGGLEQVARGYLDYWQGRTEHAREHFLAATAMGGSRLPYADLARVHLAFIAADTREPGLVADALVGLNEVSSTHAYGVPWPTYVALARALLAFAAGRTEAAISIARQVPRDGNVPVTVAKLAELFRRAGETAECERLITLLESRPRPTYVAVAALVTRAILTSERGKVDSAHIALERAIDLAVADDVVQPFQNGGAQLRELLIEHTAWGSRHDGFIARQLSSAEAVPSRRAVLGNALSPKEREILAFLRTSMSTADIALALHLSVNTVKTHQRSIYRKLGVTNRRDALKVRL